VVQYGRVRPPRRRRDRIPDPLILLGGGQVQVEDKSRPGERLAVFQPDGAGEGNAGEAGVCEDGQDSGDAGPGERMQGEHVPGGSADASAGEETVRSSGGSAAVMLVVAAENPPAAGHARPGELCGPLGFPDRTFRLGCGFFLFLRGGALFLIVRMCFQVGCVRSLSR
jgi:hypothetical protein